MLAKKAIQAERETGADASLLIYGWARRTLDYATATMTAVEALYRHAGARTLLGEQLMKHVDVDGASATDQDLPLRTASSRMKLLIDTDIFCKLGAAAGLISEAVGVFDAHVAAIQAVYVPALP